MIQLLLHLFGDFIVQNDWMALNKKKCSPKGYLACAIHCITYALPFLLVTSWFGVALICATHFLLDKYQVITWFLAIRNNAEGLENFGYKDERPKLISVWLNIFTDNSFHLIMNYIIIRLL